MQGDSFYLGFSAYVQVAVAFGFGLLYLYKNNRSIFKGIQTALFDAFRKNALFKWLLGYPAYVSGKVRARRDGTFLNWWKGLLSSFKTVFNASLDMERTCDYLAVLGIVSGFYSIGWLLFVPWAYRYGAELQDTYMTLTTSTVVADVIMVIYALIMHVKRAKAFIFSAIVMTLCCGVGMCLYQHSFYLLCPMSFDDFFVLSMAVPFSSVSFFLIHLQLFVLFRLVVVILSLLLAFPLHITMKIRELSTH